MSKTSSFYFASLLLASCSVYGIAQAQQTPQSSLPDAPGAILASNAHDASADDTSSSNGAAAEPPALQQGNASTSPSGQSTSGQPAAQTKRILGIIPNFRAVSANTKLPPQSPKEKLLTATQDSFDYTSLVLPAVVAGYSQATNQTPEFHQGAAGYARYYWHTLADTADENFMVSGLGPIVFRQDNRFYTLGHGSVGHRAFYAATRVLITREDDGDRMFNFSEVVGSGAAAGVSTLYYPTKYRTWTKVGQKWLTSDIIDGANFIFKEFWFDINKKIFHTH